MIDEIRHHLETWATIIGSIGVIVVCRKWICSFGKWIANAYTRPARIEGMIERINYAMFNDGNGMERKIARLAACHDVQFEAAPYPAFECSSAGRNARSNEAYRILTQTRSMKRLWIGKGLDGLLLRREAEAKLFEKGLSAD